MSRNS